MKNSLIKYLDYEHNDKVRSNEELDLMIRLDDYQNSIFTPVDALQ